MCFYPYFKMLYKQKKNPPHGKKHDREHEIFLYIYNMSTDSYPYKNTTDDVQKNQYYSNYNLNHTSPPPRAIWAIPVS